MADGSSFDVVEGGGASRPLLGRLGGMLVDEATTTPSRLAEALDLQEASGRRLGEILSRRGWVGREALADALARQSGLRSAPVATFPLDTRLGSAEDSGFYLQLGVAPWRREAGRRVWAVADPGAARRLCAAGDPRGPSPEDEIAVADPDQLSAAILEAYAEPLAARAAGRTPGELSVRTGVPTPWRMALGMLALALVLGIALSPGATALTVLAGLVMMNAGNAALRVAVLGAALRRRETPPGLDTIADRRACGVNPPVVTLLVPLLREPETLPVLFEALEALDWPRELLDVILILEADDDLTRDEIDRISPPPFCRVLIAPPGEPRTKPRALNVALDVARGDVIGVYDAEDRPEPDQIRRVVAALRASPPEVACVQARLAYFNARENWMTRCFTIEYAIWFDVLVGGFRDLRLPIPLGGTSVFFRRAALERLGAWDAHNVTEDADLGMRLARAGFRCEVIDSTTHEEANGRLLSWVRQRSRWLKGYALTWLTHMRDPVRLFRELGPVGFLGFQTIFLGALVAYFGLPAFWAVWISVALGNAPEWLSGLPAWALGSVAIVQLSGWLAMIAAALIATTRRRQGWLAPWIPTLVIYWPLGAVAAYLALAELFLAPTLWRKTTHGVGRCAKTARRRALLARRRLPPGPCDTAPSAAAAPLVVTS